MVLCCELLDDWIEQTWGVGGIPVEINALNSLGA